MKYKIKFTTQLKKDLKLAKRQGKKLRKLYDTVEKLAKSYNWRWWCVYEMSVV
jgi:mRNA interferase YafQ